MPPKKEDPGELVKQEMQEQLDWHSLEEEEKDMPEGAGDNEDRDSQNLCRYCGTNMWLDWDNFYWCDGKDCPIKGEYAIEDALYSYSRATVPLQRATLGKYKTSSAKESKVKEEIKGLKEEIDANDFSFGKKRENEILLPLRPK